MIRGKNACRGLALVAAWVFLSGCSGCEERLLDDVEERLRAHPDRPGKVGTLVALQVSQTARSVAEDRLERGDEPCNIGWYLDEPFSMVFELEIQTTIGSWRRHWTEEGAWLRDEEGRWKIDSRARFSEGEYTVGQRRQTVFSDEQGFWQWIGDDLAVRHPPGGAAETRWRREFGGRFSGLMSLLSDTWQPDEQGDGQRWIPGGTPRLCGPVDATDTSAAWEPILKARAQRRMAQIASQITEGEERNARSKCRVLKARYDLERGGEMTIDFRECLGAPPAALERPRAGRLVDVQRISQPATVQRQLAQWMESGLVAGGESDESQED